MVAALDFLDGRLAICICMGGHQKCYATCNIILTRAVPPSLLFHEVVQLRCPITRMFRTTWLNCLLTSLAPHMVANRKGTVNLRLGFQIMSIDKPGMMTSETGVNTRSGVQEVETYLRQLNGTEYWAISISTQVSHCFSETPSICTNAPGMTVCSQHQSEVKMHSRRGLLPGSWFLWSAIQTGQSTGKRCSSILLQTWPRAQSLQIS